MMAGWSRPASKVKLLVMYIHRENNPLTPSFVRIFQSGRVHQLLSNNCVLWGWDISLEENERSLLNIVSENLGYDNAWRLQHCGKNMFPCFIFLSRTDKKSGVALVQVQRATAELGFAVAIFVNAVQIFMTKIRPQLVSKEGRDTDRSFPDRSSTSVEALSQSKKGQSKKGRSRDGPSDDNYMDNSESMQSLSDKTAGRATDPFYPASGSSQSPPNYVHRESARSSDKSSLSQNVEIVSQNKKGQSKGLAKGRPPRASDDDYIDNGESIQSLADKMAGRAADLSALFRPESESPNKGTESSKAPPNYPHRESDAAAKKRLAELKKQYLEAEYQRLRAEKKAIFSRILQEDLAAKNQSSPSSNQPEGVDWELRKKLKNSDASKNDRKNHVSPKQSFRPTPPEGRNETITIRFRSHRELFEKKFKADDTFEKLLMYLSGRGYSFTEFKILAGWPRVDITGEDSRTPLKYLNFHFKDNVILAKRKTPYPYKS